MKFEFVEFYPRSVDLSRGGRCIGTVHIYFVDCSLDIRGILVLLDDKSIRFKMPHFEAIDEDGKRVRYPHIRFTDPKDHQSLMDFLHEDVKKILRERLGIYKTKPVEATAQT